MIEEDVIEVAEEVVEQIIDFASLTDAEMFEIGYNMAHELLEILGNIYGLLVFFVVVLLCWLVYRFFSMFFWSR